MTAYKLSLTIFLAILFNIIATMPVMAQEPDSKGLPSPLSLTDSRLKIVVQSDGFYKISYQELQATGFPIAGIEPRQLQLTHQGKPVAITLIGEADGVFNAEDSLIFYGQGIESLYTTRNVYWLSLNDKNGLRITERDGKPIQTEPSARQFYETVHLEENHQYWQTLPVTSGTDHWFWERFPAAPYSATFTVTLHHPAVSAGFKGLMQAVLHGRTATEANPDHHSQLLLNNTLIDDAWWDGQTLYTHTRAISPSLLLNGENRISIQTPGDTTATVDSVYLNYFEIGYWRQFIAQNNQLSFTLSQTGPQTINISQFNQAKIDLYDITRPYQVSRIMPQVQKLAEQNYQLQFSDNPTTTTTSYLAMAESSYLRPTSMILDTPSQWQSADNGADYIIIVHKDFVNEIAPLVSYHTNQGLRVATVLIEDIYDEFSAGIETPDAIRNFLATAYYFWKAPQPRYVLLVGDANYDFHDYLGTGKPNYIPTYLYKSAAIGQVPSDNWFVSVAGNDPLPDMAIGRLPVSTITETHTLVGKIVQYQQNPSPGTWQRKAIFVTDDEVQFEAAAEEQIAILPHNYGVQRIYAKNYTQPHDPTDNIIQTINQGAVLLNYMGHGNISTWGLWSTENIFRTSDFTKLQNRDAYPFLVTGNCSNGFFAHPSEVSFAEAFILSEHGGVGAWSATGLGYPAWHYSLVNNLYQTIFKMDDTPQIGLAINSAKIATYRETGWREPIEIFTLFGDPVMKLPNNSDVFLPIVVR